MLSKSCSCKILLNHDNYSIFEPFMGMFVPLHTIVLVLSKLRGGLSPCFDRNKPYYDKDYNKVIKDTRFGDVFLVAISYFLRLNVTS